MDSEASDSALKSFLTDAQRAALDEALAEKAAEHAVAARAAGHQKALGDRKSKMGKGTGAAKKGGGGGRFTWGSVFTNSDDAEAVLDRNDPNYDSDEDRSTVVLRQQRSLKEEVDWYKKQVVGIVEEYFLSSDISDVAESLDDMGTQHLMHYFVKRLVTMSLDRKDREREMASVLLSSLYAEVIPPEQVQKGFISLVEGLADLTLDVPNAPELLATFMSRAVVDDVLPPAIVNKIPETTIPQAQMRMKMENELNSRHTAEKILRCWGSGAGISYQGTKESICSLLAEYSSSHDADEAARCLKNLSVPFFHHELVKQAMHSAVNAPASREGMVNLLARLVSTGEVSSIQFSKGLTRVSDNLADMSLDNPAAPEEYQKVLQLMRAAGLESEMAAANEAVTKPPALVKGLSAFKASSVLAVREYLSSNDVDEVARRLTELNEPGLLHIFVKQAVTLALDRKDKERELISTLLSNLFPSVLNGDAVAMGFTRLLDSADDLVLDCPDVVHLLSLFLGRAVVDEILPPSFLTEVLKSLRADSLGVSVVKSLSTLLATRHSAERLSNCWHGGSREQIKEQIKVAIQEFCTSRDVAEAAKCVRELNVPYYHHQVVVTAIEAAFDKEACAPDILSLLASLSSSGVISQTQMTKGFSRIKTHLEDEALDFGPRAKDSFANYVAQASKEGWLVQEA